MSVCRGENSDDLASIPAMTGTAAVNFCIYFNGLCIKKTMGLLFGINHGNLQNCTRLDIQKPDLCVCVQQKHFINVDCEQASYSLVFFSIFSITSL